MQGCRLGKWAVGSLAGVRDGGTAEVDGMAFDIPDNLHNIGVFEIFAAKKRRRQRREVGTGFVYQRGALIDQ